MIRDDQQFRQAKIRRDVLAAPLKDRCQRDRLTREERESLAAQVHDLDEQIGLYAWSMVGAWLAS